MTALAIESTAFQPPAAVRGDLCNLLQVAASALHLIERQLDDDLRPLIRVGLAAIGQAAATAHPAPPAVNPRIARMIP